MLSGHYLRACLVRTFCEHFAVPKSDLLGLAHLEMDIFGVALIHRLQLFYSCRADHTSYYGLVLAALMMSRILG